jgi:hypothetical protein
MPQGICKLCLQTKILQDSHFIPAAMYKYIRATSLKNPNPVVVGRERTITTSEQVRDYLLCGECEDRFNKNGEKEVLKWACKGNHFPLGNRLAVAMQHHQRGEVLAFSGSGIGVNTDKFAYFALSVIWRAAVHEWDTPWGKTTVINLGQGEEPVRQYLVGMTGMPAEAAVVLTVCTDIYSQGAFFMPSPVTNFPGMCFVFLTLGLHFMVYIGRHAGRILQDVCCARSRIRAIYQRDCSEKTIDAYRNLVMSRSLPKQSA